MDYFSASSVSLSITVVAVYAYRCLRFNSMRAWAYGRTLCEKEILLDGASSAEIASETYLTEPGADVDIPSHIQHGSVSPIDLM